jgi:hypothetical protein
VTQAGCAGIGIGTNSWAGQLTVRGCVTRSNARDGLFFESQSAGALAGEVSVVGHTSESNGAHGIADAGCRALNVLGGHSKANGKSGFAVYSGTIGAGTPGTAGMVIGLDCSSNTENGVHVDTTVNASSGDYNFRGLKLRSNTKHGVLVQVGSAALNNIHVNDCDIENHQLNGVDFVSTGGGSLADMSVTNSRLRSNGASTSATGNRNGIRVAASITRLAVRGNSIWDDQGTKTQVNGLQIDSGVTLTDGVIDGNDLRNNLTAAVSMSGTFTGTAIGLNPGYTLATGSPETVVTAPIGTQYRRTDGGAATSLYVKESGTGNTGWVAK